MPANGRRRATVRDIAAETGVSIATVSRVLNGQANVAPETRELVRRAVERLGAHKPRPRNPAAPPTGGGIFVRCPYLLTDYFGIIVSSIAETLELHNRHLILEAGEAAQQIDVLPRLPGRPGIDGAILILPPEPPEEIIALRDQRLPFVVVDPRSPLPVDIPAVSASHAAGARSLTAHLTELGHRRIGVLGGPTEWLASKGRMAGHASALAEVGVLSSPSYLLSVHPTLEDGYRGALRLLDLPEPPTAIVGFNDKLAAGALRAAGERGLRVPEDISVAGFDDIDISRVTWPELTTVRQPLQEMGRMAVVLIMRWLQSHEYETRHVELATDLVVRGSTGPASGTLARPSGHP